MLLAVLISMLELDINTVLAYTAVLAMALFPIWIGSHRSLEAQWMETMSSQDAWMFPIIGSGVLFGLYILFVVLELKEYVNLLLTAYFLFFGILASATALQPILRSFVSPTSAFVTSSYSFRSFKYTPLDMLSLVIACAVGGWYILTKNWIANNIIGLAFSIQGISYISPGSFKVACILLGGLFLYDIFWVFGTDVMVTVAKNFDAPIKVVFPKNLMTYLQSQAGESLQFNMLGLGDIVIPGIFIALMLRYDFFYRAQGKKMKDKSKKEFDKPYFNFTFVCYVLGMVTTIAVMHVFEAAQPALLYLVPFIVGGSLMCATLLGEVRELILFEEEEPKTRKPNRGAARSGAE